MEDQFTEESLGPGAGSDEAPQNPAAEELVIGKAPGAKLAEWRKAHPGIYEVCVLDEETNTLHACYLREPTRPEMSAYMAKEKRDPLGAADGLLRNVWLGGSAQINKDNALKTAAALEAVSLIKIAEATIKKL